MNSQALTVQDIPDKFFIDVAVGVTEYEDICRIYNIPEPTAAQLEADPEFIRRVKIAEQSVADDGAAFRARCRTIVSDALPTMKTLMHDRDAPASSRLETFKTLAKLGQLEPKPENSGPTGPMLHFTIVAPDGRREVHVAQANSSARPALEHEPDKHIDDFSDAVADWG